LAELELAEGVDVQFKHRTAELRGQTACTVRTITHDKPFDLPHAPV
jgi:hypothetical protein